GRALFAFRGVTLGSIALGSVTFIAIGLVALGGIAFLSVAFLGVALFRVALVGVALVGFGFGCAFFGSLFGRTQCVGRAGGAVGDLLGQIADLLTFAFHLGGFFLGELFTSGCDLLAGLLQFVASGFLSRSGGLLIAGGSGFFGFAGRLFGFAERVG